jgi:hypothetical protein
MWFIEVHFNLYMGRPKGHTIMGEFEHKEYGHWAYEGIQTKKSYQTPEYLSTETESDIHRTNSV